jgi:hypothetical protein
MKLYPGSRKTFAALALATLVASGRATAQMQVGSFVTGERPMYLEVDQVVEGLPCHIAFKNVPAGASGQALIVSESVCVQDMGRVGMQGCMAPDLVYGHTIQVGANEYSAVTPAGSAGKTLYLQGYVMTSKGRRFTSMVTAHALASGGGGGNTITFPIPLTTQEVLPSDRSGWDRWAQPVRVGLPMPKGQVFEKYGVPQLTLRGGPATGQFSSLAWWSDGSCKWVLCEYLTDLSAGQWKTGVSVDKGSGNFGGASLASVSGTVTTVATGAATITLDAARDDLFQSYQVGGREVFSTAAGFRPHFWDDADAEWTWHKQAVTLRRNGPVRAEIEVDGVLTRSSSPDDADRVYLRFYLEFVRGQTSMRATVSLRDTSLSFPQHLLFRGLTIRGALNETGTLDLRMARPATNGYAGELVTGSIGSGSDALVNLGFCRRTDKSIAIDYNSSAYKGFLQRNAPDDFALEGTSLRIGATWFTGSAANGWRTAESEYSDPTFLEVNCDATGRGVLAGIEHACRTWPVELSAGGDGRIEIGLFPHERSGDSFDYPLTYASCETRVFWLAPESGPAADPFAAAASFDYPLAARADAWAYDQADVWPWHIVSTAEMADYISHSGMRTPGSVNNDPVKTVYRYAGGTGGGNNNWEETQRFYQWLLTGHGGSALNSWFEAVYKADKMFWTIDDGALKDRATIRNPTAPVTNKTYFYDGSKHTFMQVIPDWGFTRGETCLLDSAKHAAATLMDPKASPNVQPFGNFVPGTYGALTNCAESILQVEPNQDLEDWLHLIAYQWSHVVYQQDNDFGVSTATLGWQAPLGTPEGSATDPDGFMITWAAGKSSDKAQYGYMSQMWTDLREMSQSYGSFVHYLREKDPGDTLIGDLLARAPDIYHYARRGLPDDYCKSTGEYYITDVFEGDGDDSSVTALVAPGDILGKANASGYALQSICTLLLELRPSESAFSYGVELHRSMADPVLAKMQYDPILNDFVWRYLVHYGVIKP